MVRRRSRRSSTGSADMAGAAATPCATAVTAGAVAFALGRVSVPGDAAAGTPAFNAEAGETVRVQAPAGNMVKSAAITSIPAMKPAAAAITSHEVAGRF